MILGLYYRHSVRNGAFSPECVNTPYAVHAI